MILQAVAPIAIVLAGVGYQVLHAGTDTFIRALPQGHDAELRGSGSRKGTHLSVRQQQLLALASVPALAGRVLLLDEATAVIDSASDAAFRRAPRVLYSRRAAAC